MDYIDTQKKIPSVMFKLVYPLQSNLQHCWLEVYEVVQCVQLEILPHLNTFTDSRLIALYEAVLINAFVFLVYDVIKVIFCHIRSTVILKITQAAI